MAASGDILSVVDGSEFRITKAAADTDGGYLEMEWSLPPSTETPPKHIHPQQREDYEVLEGAFEVFVRDGWRIVGAGESASGCRRVVMDQTGRCPFRCLRADRLGPRWSPAWVSGRPRRRTRP